MTGQAHLHDHYLQEAIEEALRGVAATQGGPFGALVVRDGVVLGRGNNRVTSSRDPTAHAEVVAIRRACADADDFKLSGAILYASCEPCPMCLGATYWARIERVYYAATRHDAARAGFDDAALHGQLEISRTCAVALHHRPHPRLEEPFAAWNASASRIPY